MFKVPKLKESCDVSKLLKNIPSGQSDQEGSLSRWTEHSSKTSRLDSPSTYSYKVTYIKSQQETLGIKNVDKNNIPSRCWIYFLIITFLYGKYKHKEIQVKCIDYSDVLIINLKLKVHLMRITLCKPQLPSLQLNFTSFCLKCRDTFTIKSISGSFKWQREQDSWSSMEPCTKELLVLLIISTVACLKLFCLHFLS